MSGSAGDGRSTYGHAHEGVHWAARPLPPPVRNHRALAPDGAPEDLVGALLEQWIEELRIGNTIDGD